MLVFGVTEINVCNYLSKSLILSPGSVQERAQLRVLPGCLQSYDRNRWRPQSWFLGVSLQVDSWARTTSVVTDVVLRELIYGHVYIAGTSQLSLK